MSKVLPILFNTEMVQAILDGRKTVTRRLVRRDTNMILGSPYHKSHPELSEKDIVEKMCTKPCKPGDILYVRETFDYLEGWKIGDPGIDGKYYYRADGDLRPVSWRGKWHPSLHMPKEATRIFLKVKDVRAERLQEITVKGIEKEGIYLKKPYTTYEMQRVFKALWDSTIKKSDLDRYGWDSDPWVWVIEFEMCKKPENW